jgi:hypothetical protein
MVVNMMSMPDLSESASGHASESHDEL